MKWKQSNRQNRKNWTAEKRETSIFWLQYVILKRCNKMWPLLTFLPLSIFLLHFMWLLLTIRNERKKRRISWKYNPINFGLLGNHHTMDDVHITWSSSSSSPFLYGAVIVPKSDPLLFVAFGAIGRFILQETVIMSFAPLAMFNVGIFTAAFSPFLVYWKWKPKVQFQSRNVYRLWVEIWFEILAGA